MDALKLENQLCFPLYAAARETVKQYKPFLAELKLTYTQYIALLVLWEHKEMNVKTLGAYLYLDSGTLTPLLKKLEKDGLVARERSFKDERELSITLTPKGEALRERALHIPQKVSACMPLSLEEAQTLHRLLYKLLPAR